MTPRIWLLALAIFVTGMAETSLSASCRPWPMAWPYRSASPGN